MNQGLSLIANNFETCYDHRLRIQYDKNNKTCKERRYFPNTLNNIDPIQLFFVRLNVRELIMMYVL